MAQQTFQTVAIIQTLTSIAKSPKVKIRGNSDFSIKMLSNEKKEDGKFLYTVFVKNTKERQTDPQEAKIVGQDQEFDVEEKLVPILASAQMTATAILLHVDFSPPSPKITDIELLGPK